MTDKNPLKIHDEVGFPKLNAPMLGKDRQGKFVAVRLAGEEDKNTYLGIYMGDIGGITATIDDGVLVIGRHDFMGNPTIYVPALNQIVYGRESWWGEVNSPDDLKQITDQDIENVWYVQALKAMAKEGGAA